MEPMTVAIIIVALILIYIIFVYNKIIHAKNMNKEAFSNVDVALKQRYDLIPNLKASEGFIKFQDNLVKVEETIENARRYYNGTVRNYNIIIQKFPNNIIAKLFRCKDAEYFEIELVTKENPKINLN